MRATGTHVRTARRRFARRVAGQRGGDNWTDGPTDSITRETPDVPTLTRYQHRPSVQMSALVLSQLGPSGRTSTRLTRG